MRRVSTRVLPEPAPASITRVAPGCVTAWRWASFNPSSSVSASMRPTLPRGPPGGRDPDIAPGRGGNTLAARCPNSLRAVIDVPPERFEELVVEALDTIPDELARRIENVAVRVHDGAPGLGLLGLYEGIP